MKNAIRLTNKTARALKRSADKVRSAYFIAAGIFSAAMACFAVFLGLRWLPAVPVTVLLTAAADCLIVMRANALHLSMTAQAICTEAAAREIRAGASESQRRQKAITDLISVKADAQAAVSAKKAEEKAPGKMPFFEESDDQDVDDAQEDEDLYAGNTMKIRPVKEKQEKRNSAESEEKAEPRRRRRKDGLKLIRGEQAR